MGWDAGAAAARFRGSVGGARHPEFRGCTVRYCKYCDACKLSGSVLQVCLRRLVFVCTSCKAFHVAREAVWIRKQCYRSYCCSWFGSNSRATLVKWFGHATLPAENRDQHPDEALYGHYACAIFSSTSNKEEQSIRFWGWSGCGSRMFVKLHAGTALSYTLLLPSIDCT